MRTYTSFQLDGDAEVFAPIDVPERPDRREFASDAAWEWACKAQAPKRHAARLAVVKAIAAGIDATPQNYIPSAVWLAAEALGAYGGGWQDPGCATRRLEVFRGLGKGRRGASDGPAWTAAIEQAYHEAYTPSMPPMEFLAAWVNTAASPQHHAQCLLSMADGEDAILRRLAQSGLLTDAALVACANAATSGGSPSAGQEQPEDVLRDLASQGRLTIPDIVGLEQFVDAS